MQPDPLSNRKIGNCSVGASVAYLAKVFLRFPFAYKLVGRLVGRGLSTFLFLR